MMKSKIFKRLYQEYTKRFIGKILVLIFILKCLSKYILYIMKCIFIEKNRGPALIKCTIC